MADDGDGRGRLWEAAPTSREARYEERARANGRLLVYAMGVLLVILAVFVLGGGR